MNYDEWYNEGIEKGYVREYTTKFVDALISNVEDLERAFTPSVKSKLGKSVIKQMDDMGHQKYWLMIQRDMMKDDDYWDE